MDLEFLKVRLQVEQSFTIKIHEEFCHLWWSDPNVNSFKTQTPGARLLYGCSGGVVKL